MILWNACYDYFIHKGSKPKLIAFGILAALFLLKKFGIIARLRSWCCQVPKKIWLVLALLLGGLLRILWVLWSPYSPPAAGTEDYVMIRHGRELAEGSGYITTTGLPSADRPIGYALLLAGIFKTVGVNLDVIAALNILCSMVTLWLVYRIGKQIHSEAVGIGAAFLYAFYPTSIFSTPIVLEEHFFIPIWLGGISLLIEDYKRKDLKKVVAAGLLFGIAAHFRTFSFAMGLVAFFVWVLFKRSFRQAFVRLLLIQFLILLFAIPWAIRNQQKLGEPVLYTTWVGATLYISNNEISDVRYPINPTPEQGGDRAFSQAQTEIERNRTGKAAALTWIKANPGLFIQKALGRVVYMLGLTREGWVVKDNFNSIRQGRNRPSDKVIGKIDKMDNDYYGVIFLLAVFGVVMLFFRREPLAQQGGVVYLLVTLAYYLSIIAITLGHRKYRFPIEPFFCILAAYGISFFINDSSCTKFSKKQQEVL